MKRFFLFFSFCLFCAEAVIGQIAFKPGYVVTLENDTLRGLVSASLNKSGMLSCRFKDNEKITPYSSTQIKAWGSDAGKAYSSAVFGNRFVEELLLGKVSLYRQKHNYYLKKDTVVVTLQIVEKLYLNTEGDAHMLENAVWKGKMNVLMSDQMDMLPRIERATLTERQLTKLVRQYNKRSGAPFVEHKKNLQWLSTSVGVKLGVLVSSVQVEENKPTAELTDYYTNTGFAVGGFLLVKSPRINKNVSMEVGLSYAKNSYSSLQPENSFSIYDYNTSIDVNCLSIPITLQYGFHVTGSNEIMLGLGCYAISYIDVNNQYKKQFFDQASQKTIVSFEGEIFKQIDPVRPIKPWFVRLTYLKHLKHFTLGGQYQYHRQALSNDTRMRLNDNGHKLSLLMLF